MNTTSYIKTTTKLTRTVFVAVALPVVVDAGRVIGAFELVVVAFEVPAIAFVGPVEAVFVLITLPLHRQASAEIMSLIDYLPESCD